MPALRVVKHGEPPLKKTCPPFDYDAQRAALPRLLRDMWATMEAARGVGLAAPQIGLSLRLAVIDVRPDGKRQPLVLINPEIVSRAGSLREEEGCLSLPGVYARVARSARVRVRALDAHGRPWEMEGSGLLGRAFQHEIDHLDGRLFIDHLEFEARLKVLDLVRGLKRTWT